MQEYKEYRPILERDDMTVVAEYVPSQDRSYLLLPEDAIERRFVDQLAAQGYEKVDFHSAQGLRDNLRRQLETLNNTRFSESEWETLLSLVKTANSTENDKVAAKSELLWRFDAKFDLERDDGTIKNVMLLDRANLHANRLQVARQYKATGGTTKNRYDVTILVNGLPLVHVELKKPGGRLKEAFNQIERYKNDSFWSDDGLFEYVQIFVISTAVETRYYSNTTHVLAAEENANPSQKGTKKRSSASFEFTSRWADAKNKPIISLFDFASTFLAKNTILSILTKYCVFTAERRLLVMRPYQIAATERILQKVNFAINSNDLWRGTKGGGYIWHTTGSGKTLTSFKTAQLAAQRDEIDKVLFVVDRKDLDYQTIREYDRFEKGAANGSRNTAILDRQLHDFDAKGLPRRYPIIVTTIQKLQNFVKRAEKSDPVFQKRFVFIFDECHRSQFGEMRDQIDRAFKKRLLFGFTGTPIFKENAVVVKGVKSTTADAFGERIHTYNIIDAIKDENVLKFHVEMHDAKGGTEGGENRAQVIVERILKDFNTKTRRNEASYEHKTIANVKKLVKNPGVAVALQDRTYRGFNAIFAVESIPALMDYYQEFKKQLGENFGTAFKIATIFSYAPKKLSNSVNPNEDTTGGELFDFVKENDSVASETVEGEAIGTLDEENTDDVNGLPDNQKEFLRSAIDNYNKSFQTSYSVEGESFGDYYKDVSMRVKNREVDLLLVVNMFLTGFDAPALNTLWVDKNLRYHGMLQAFSRTNRILNATKPQGEIVSFRDLREELNDMLALFGDKDAASIAILRTFKEYVEGYYDEVKKQQVAGYYELVENFKKTFKPDVELLGEKTKREFVNRFSEILRIRSIIETFEEFTPFSAESDRFDENEFLGYKEQYLVLYDEFRRKRENGGKRGEGGDEGDNGDGAPDDSPEFELELVASLDVDVEYILKLVDSHKEKTEEEREESLEKIRRLVDSSLALRPKRDLFLRFAENAKPDDDVYTKWRDFVRQEYAADLDALVNEERLKPQETRDYLESVLDAANLGDDPEMVLAGEGTQIDALLPPVSMFHPNPEGLTKIELKARVLEKLRRLFEKFCGIFAPEE